MNTTKKKTNIMKRIAAVAIMLVMMVSGMGVAAVSANAGPVGTFIVLGTVTEMGREDNIKEDIVKYQNTYLEPQYDYNTGKYGYVNDRGEWIIPPQYEEAYEFHSEVARVKKSNGQYNYITKGNRQCNITDYDVALDFNSNGTAFVKSNANDSNYTQINVCGIEQ